MLGLEIASIKNPKHKWGKGKPKQIVFKRFLHMRPSELSIHSFRARTNHTQIQEAGDVQSEATFIAGVRNCSTGFLRRSAG